MKKTDNRDRDWYNTTTSQRMPKINDHHKNLGRGKQTFSQWVPQGA